MMAEVTEIQCSLGTSRIFASSEEREKYLSISNKYFSRSSKDVKMRLVPRLNTVMDVYKYKQKNTISADSVGVHYGNIEG